MSDILPRPKSVGFPAPRFIRKMTTKDFINKITCGDCFELMEQLKDNSIDCIITDPPYNTTRNSWDTEIDLDVLFTEFWRVLKEHGTIVMFSQQPFTTIAIMNQKENFKYELIWNKIRVSGFLNANRMPLRSHENILIFYKKRGTYNTQKMLGDKSHSKGSISSDVNNNYGKYGKIDLSAENGSWKFPKSVLEFMKPHPAVHPTQKSLNLINWLIRTYSNENDIILDPFSGSGTTSVACKQSNRNSINFELSREYCDIAEKRLNALPERLDKFIKLN